MNNAVAEKELVEVIQEIHRSPWRIVLSVTGGGSEAIGELLRHGNGSATLLEALVPYDRNSLTGFIGREPDSYCSEETAREMAMSAFERALLLGGMDSKDNVMGIGVTCKLTRTRSEREGRTHQIHFASQSLLRTSASSLILLNSGTREEEEKIASLLIIYRLAQLCSVDTGKYPVLFSPPGLANLKTRVADASPEIGDLLANTLLQDENTAKQAIEVFTPVRKERRPPRVIFAGSFNPCHKNHIAMARTAFKDHGFPVCFEISLANVDKPPIDYISLEYRLNSLRKYTSAEFMGDIYLTNAPLFADKATLFPECCFIIGTDTLNRTFNERYYRSGETKHSLLEHFRTMGVSFMVFRRKGVELAPGEDVKDIVRVVELSEYEDDGTSSTLIRRAGKEPA